jgi:alpha-tubulin suppressor-like RCC1 family protein
VLTNGSAVCWGNGEFGRLGNGSAISSLVPVFVSGNYAFSSMSLGEEHSCGLLTNGSAVCWGEGSSGRLGDGSQSDSYVPIFVAGSYNFSSISVGIAHSCGVLVNGNATCWGSNTYGKLGNGNTVLQNTPVFVSGGYDYIDNNYYWNKNTFISLLPMNYYSPADTVVFECTAMNQTSQSLPINYTLVI